MDSMAVSKIVLYSTGCTFEVTLILYSEMRSFLFSSMRFRFSWSSLKYSSRLEINVICMTFEAEAFKC
jgi:hypothetical protein